MNKFVAGTIAAVLLVTLTGCDDPPPEPKERIRAIKTFTVAERAGGKSRTFSGTAQAVDTSSLSFEVSGNVSSLEVDPGDKVQEGQLIATLDRTRFELAVDAAQADVGRADASVTEKTAELERQQKLFDKGWVSKAALDQAQAASVSVANDLRYSHSQLNLALRDLEQTELRAPFSGVISARHVEPFQEVSRAEQIYSLYGEGAMEIRINVPETSINSLNIGLPGEVEFASGDIGVLKGIVAEIGTSPEAGNTYRVEIAILDSGTSVLPGMTASVTLLLDEGLEGDAFLIPIGAIVPGERPHEGFVYRYDEASSTVRRVPIKGGGVRGDLIIVAEGISPGDIIAVAGTSFLRDGQKVKLLAPQ